MSPWITLFVCFLSAATLPWDSAAPAHHDFGSVLEGTEVTWIFKLRNSSPAPVQIERVQCSQPGMSARFLPVVPPGEEAAVTVKWVTVGFKGKVAGEAEVQLTGGGDSLPLVLSGEVRPVVDLLPLPAVFFSLYRDESAEQRVRIVNRDGDRPLEIHGLESNGTHFRAAIETVEPGKIYELAVSVPPGQNAGRFLEGLYIETGHPLAPRIPVPVNVLVKQDVHVSVESLDFGKVRRSDLQKAPGLRDLLTQTFTVRRRQGGLEILSISTDLDFLEIRRTPSSGRANIVRLDAVLVAGKLSPGSFSGSVRIRTSDPRFPELRVPVSIAIE